MVTHRTRRLEKNTQKVQPTTGGHLEFVEKHISCQYFLVELPSIVTVEILQTEYYQYGGFDLEL